MYRPALLCIHGHCDYTSVSILLILISSELEAPSESAASSELVTSSQLATSQIGRGE